ncbi:MAG: hypothetical protein QOD89_3049 [Bradyrhizobium sp.]|nr:hypothetical protein [Bradyrhizobium sp.]
MGSSRKRSPVRVVAGWWTSRDGAAVARRAHNPKVGGSNPSPATKHSRMKAGSPPAFVVSKTKELTVAGGR